MRLISASISALMISVAVGVPHSWYVTAAEPNAAGKKQVTLSLPSGELLGFEINKKTVPLERIVPGIRSALLLSDEQLAQIDAAQRETVQSEAVRNAGLSLKSAPDAKAEDKTKAKEVVAAARQQLVDKVSAILTPEQKELVKKLNAAAAESQAAVSESLRAEQKGAKGDNAKSDELRERKREPLIAEFKSRAAKFLNAEQLAALDKGIAEQKAAEERAKSDPKASKVKPKSSKDGNPKVEPSKDKAAKVETSKDKISKVESSKGKTSKDTTTKEKASNNKAAKVEASKDKTSKDTTTKEKVSKDKTPKKKTPNDKASKDETPKDKK